MAAGEGRFFVKCVRRRRTALLRGGDLVFRLRCDGCTGANALQAVDDDRIAGGKAAVDDALAVSRCAGLDLAVAHLVFGIDDKDEPLVLIRADGAVADDYPVFRLRFTHAHPHELAGNEPAIRIFEDRTHTNGAAGGIDLVVDEVQGALDRRAFIRKRADFYRDLFERGQGVGCLRQLGQRFRYRSFAGVEAGIDRVDRNQRRQGRRCRAGGNEVAGGDFDAADPAGNRCNDFGVTKIELSRRQRRAGGAKLGFGIRKRALPLVEIALGDRAIVGKPAATVEFRLGKADLGFGGGDLGFSTCNGCLIGAGSMVKRGRLPSPARLRGNARP